MNFTNKNQTSIVFTGDIGFDSYMDGQWKNANLFSDAVLDFFNGALHVCANIEGALTDIEDDGSRGIFFHKMNPEAVCALNKINANIWSIGNNHSMDAGVDGLINTKALAKANNCHTIGAGLNELEASKPIILKDGGGVGIFTLSYPPECIPATATSAGNFRWDDMSLIAKRIEQIKKECRWCVVVVHGGEEFTCLPNPYTRARYIKYLQMGADIVVGHHPHVAQNYELFEDGKAIFYSLGNFIFDTNYQRAHLYTDCGVLLKLIFTKEKFEFEALGTKIIRGEQRIEKAPLPDIFTNVTAFDYEMLAPLSAKAFVEEERRKMIFLEPARFTNANKEVWDDYFFSEEPDGFVKDEHMDFSVIIPFSLKAEKGYWKKSKLESVKKYILKLL